MILHFSQIRLTLGRTFMLFFRLSVLCSERRSGTPGRRAPWSARAQVPEHSLVAIGDPSATEVVRRQLNLDAVTGKDPDVVHAHLSGDVGQHGVAVVEL